MQNQMTWAHSLICSICTHKVVTGVYFERTIDESKTKTTELLTFGFILGRQNDARACLQFFA